MAGENNVVEVRLRAVDEFTAGFRNLSTQIKGVLGFVGIASVGIAVKALVSNIIEAEEAASQLNAAFAATGRTLGLTRDDLDDLASEMQRTTTFSDELVKQGESILLTFDKVRGQAFERTIRAAGDLSARFGTDLPSAVRQLGRALQDPERGLQALTRAGVTFSDSQREQIKALTDSGRVMEAQNLILAEVERRFKGAAEAARNTLGGALKGLKNAFGDLFEGTGGGVTPATKAINDLTAALTNPALKRAIDSIITGAANAFGLLGRAAGTSASLVQSFFDRVTGAYGKLPAPVRAILERSTKIGVGAALPFLGALDRIGGGGAAEVGKGKQPFGPRDRRPDIGTEEDAFAGLDEIEVRVRRISSLEDPVTDMFAKMEETTQTSLQKQLADWEAFDLDLRVLVSQGVITATDAATRRMEKLDEILPEIQVTAKKVFPQVREEITAVSEAARAATEDIHGAFTDVFLSIGQGTDNFVESVGNAIRRMFANLAATMLVEALGIEKILKDLAKSFSGSTSGNSAKGGFLQAVGSGLASLFGGSASGGSFSGLQLVGEEGPELVSAGINQGRALNRRQLAFAGGGAAVHYAPVNNVTIVARTDNADDLRREVAAFFGASQAKNNREFSRMLERNGFGRLR